MKKLRLKELNRLSVAEFKQKPKAPLVLVLDNIRSALNVGSAFRTADAFAIEAVYCCGITAQPPHRDILKTAIGASESVAWQYFPEVTTALKMLREKGKSIIAIEQTDQSQNLATFSPDHEKGYALIFGNEVKGVSEEALDYCDAAIEVPQFGTKHSLNVSVCVGVVCWEFIRQLKW